MRVRTGIGDGGSALARHAPSQLDYLSVCIHARRSRMAEGARLDELCRIHSVAEFIQAIYPKSDVGDAVDFQRLVVGDVIRELSAFSKELTGPGAELFNWVLVRFQIENLKALMRLSVTKRGDTDVERFLVDLPKPLNLNVRGLASAESLEEFTRLVPRGPLRGTLARVLELYPDYPIPFFPEAALDQTYLQGLLDRVRELPWEERAIVRPMICQEVDIFHFMLALRGRFHYGLAPETLMPLHVPGTRILQPTFARMLQDSDLNTAVGRVAEVVLDVPPVEGAREGAPGAAFGGQALERLAWTRFRRLANLAFRRSHIGLGAVVGYTGLRRMEAANLITISEGIGKGMNPAAIRERLISPGGAEVSRV